MPLLAIIPIVETEISVMVYIQYVLTYFICYKIKISTGVKEE